MSNTAFQNQYRQEFIHGFEQTQSLIRDAVTNEAVIKGNQAIFLVADSGSATTVTRGVNGLIPARADNMTQYTCILTEEHDLARKTGFNIFASQGDQKRIMQETSMGVVNRRIDTQIISALGSATNDTGTAATASMNLVTKSRAILGQNSVPITDGNLCALISPAFEAYLLQIKEFASADYVDGKPLVGANAGFNNSPKMINWLNCNWIVSPLIAGIGTSAELCYMFHKNAIGHAINVAGLQSEVGYDSEMDYSFARTSAYMGAKLLQNSGVVQMIHDGSAYVAS